MEPVTLCVIKNLHWFASCITSTVNLTPSPFYKCAGVQMTVPLDDVQGEVDRRSVWCSICLHYHFCPIPCPLTPAKSMTLLRLRRQTWKPAFWSGTLIPLQHPLIISVRRITALQLGSEVVINAFFLPHKISITFPKQPINWFWDQTEIGAGFWPWDGPGCHLMHVLRGAYSLHQLLVHGLHHLFIIQLQTNRFQPQTAQCLMSGTIRNSNPIIKTLRNPVLKLWHSSKLACFWQRFSSTQLECWSACRSEPADSPSLSLTAWSYKEYIQ